MMFKPVSKTVSTPAPKLKPKGMFSAGRDNMEVRKPAGKRPPRKGMMKSLSNATPFGDTSLKAE